MSNLFRDKNNPTIVRKEKVNLSIRVSLFKYLLDNWCCFDCGSYVNFTKPWCSSKISGKGCTSCLTCGDSKLFYESKPMKKCLNWYLYGYVCMIKFEFEVLLDIKYLLVLLISLLCFLKVKVKRIQIIICLWWLIDFVFLYTWW